MRSRIITDFINLFLRFSSLAGRFLLIFLITKFLSIEDLGVFGIINTSIALGVFLIGFEYHNYHTRKLLQIEFSEVPSKVRDQFGFHLVCYILIIPILYLFFISELIPSYLFFLFALVLFLEHMGQEIYRILLAFGNIIEGNIVLFIRSAVWVLVLLIYWMDSETVPNLNHLFLLWSFGALISLTLGLFWMHRNNLINFNTGAMDINWILNGIKVSKFFFISSLSFKIVEYSDRFFIDHFLGKEEVGVFT
ncbi:MAG: O-antigen/teichoic acid export membrane protein, partial [Parvicella sp.]